jgi:hypothetical protein
MTRTFKIGDRVSWNSEAGRVSGTVIRVHIHNIDHKGYTHQASPDVPQYEIKSAKTTMLPYTRALRSQGFGTNAIIARRDR